jgi:hypothetical protein
VPIKDKPELAYKHGIQRTIPMARSAVSVTTSSGTTSLAAFGGKWVWLKARTADITILRGAKTLTAGAGLVLASTDDYREFFVDDGGDLTLSHISTASATLEILHDGAE